MNFEQALLKRQEVEILAERGSFVLEEKHFIKATEIIKEHITPKYKKNKVCNRCGGSGIESVTKEGLTQACSRCTQQNRCMEDWLEYCKASGDKKLEERFLKEGESGV